MTPESQPLNNQPSNERFDSSEVVTATAEEEAIYERNINDIKAALKQDLNGASEWYESHYEHIPQISLSLESLLEQAKRALDELTAGGDAYDVTSPLVTVRGDLESLAGEFLVDFDRTKRALLEATDESKERAEKQDGLAKEFGMKDPDSAMKAIDGACESVRTAFSSTASDFNYVDGALSEILARAAIASRFDEGDEYVKQALKDLMDIIERNRQDIFGSEQGYGDNGAFGRAYYHIAETVHEATLRVSA